MASLPATLAVDMDVTTTCHSIVVRATHWVTAIATAALIVSGAAILLAHPRLYWGETGAVGAPSLIDLPIPFLLGHSGWGRYLHFLAAWVSVGAGLLYLVYGVLSGHFYRRMVPSRNDLAWVNLGQAVSDHVRLTPVDVQPASYNVLQRLSYVAIVFAVGPLVLLSGLANPDGPAISIVHRTRRSTQRPGCADAGCGR